MAQILLLICVLLNIVTHATEINEIEKELIAKTLKNIYTKAEENLTKTCPICYEEIKRDFQALRTICGHLLCQKCMKQHSKNCPLCFSPGKYKIKRKYCAALKSIELVTARDEIVKKYTTGDIVNIVEIKELKHEQRIRGKLNNGLWITLQNTQNGACWIKRVEKNNIIEEPSQNVIAKTLKNIYTKAEENIKLPDEFECMVCYEQFPVSLQFTCGHELCAVCLESMIKICDTNNCPKCRAHLHLPKIFTKWLTIIKIYPIQLTPVILLEDLQGAFPLICSVANLTTVIKCVNMGMDVNTKGFFGKFPLSSAKQKHIVKYLVNKGADVNQFCDDGATPLSVSSQEGNLLLVKYLIKKGAKINQLQNGAATPLLMSSQHGHLPVVKYLVQNGANVNRCVIPNGETSLLMSSKNGHLPVIKYLVENGANINQASNCGMTPLLMSSKNGDLKIVQYLVENGANLNQTNDKGATPLCLSCQNGHLPVVKYLVENGTNVNQASHCGISPLFTSSQKGHLLIVQYLVENGADIHQANGKGSTPLSVSSQEGHLSIIQYLLKNGADVNHEGYAGTTPLSVALYNDQTEAAKFLLRKNANVENTRLVLKKYGLLKLVNNLDDLSKQIEE